MAVMMMTTATENHARNRRIIIQHTKDCVCVCHIEEKTDALPAQAVRAITDFCPEIYTYCGTWPFWVR